MALKRDWVRLYLALCLCYVDRTQSFSQFYFAGGAVRCGALARADVFKTKGLGTALRQLPCGRRTSGSTTGGLYSARATVSERKELILEEGVGVSPADDLSRKMSWTLRRAEGLRAAASKDVVELKYLEIECPGTQPGLEAEPLLILHGLLGSSRNFQSFAKALSGRLARPRRIIIPDLRNHGDSPHARSMSYLSMAMDVVSLLDKLDIDRSCIIGHSMGGKVAAALALYYSERVEAVGILDIAPVDYSKPLGADSTWKDISGIITALHSVPEECMADKKLVDLELQKSIADPVLRAFALTNLARDPKAGRMRWKIGIDNLWRNMGIIGGFDLGQGLQAPASELGLSFKRDAFFVQGGKSRFISSRHLPEIQAMFPRFKLSTIRNCGHWVHSEDPETTINNVLMFLDRPNPTPFEKFLERGL